MTDSINSARGRAATMEDVAREAGVSRATVSLVYRGAKGPSKASIDAVQAAGERLGYRRNANAARLASKGTDTLGLFILDLSNEVFIDIFEGTREALGTTDHNIVLAAGQTGGKNERETVEGLLSVQVGAAIVAGSMLPDGELRDLASTSPFVVVSRLVPGVDSVASDDRLGGEIATKHLLKLGHENIVYLVPPVGPHYTGRSEGYRQTMQAAGLAPREVKTGFTRAEASATARRILSIANPPTAIFADSDVAALGVLATASELGLQVPRDLSVLGYDDTRAASLSGIGLSSVSQQARQLGWIGADYAITRMAAERKAYASGSADPEGAPAREPELEARHTLLEPTLRLRGTTTSPRLGPLRGGY